jgi:hypothetical protein
MTTKRTYTEPSCVQFVKDMEAADIEVEHYRGRYYWEGPAVRVGHPHFVQRATKVPVQWDRMGLGIIVYPKSKDPGTELQGDALDAEINRFFKRKPGEVYISEGHEASGELPIKGAQKFVELQNLAGLKGPWSLEDKIVHYLQDNLDKGLETDQFLPGADYTFEQAVSLFKDFLAYTGNPKKDDGDAVGRKMGRNI